VTHSVPGLAFALLGRKQPWLWGFIGSFLASLALGDRLEKRAVLVITEKIRQAEARKHTAEAAQEPA
jgi:hypothetical protein